VVRLFNIYCPKRLLVLILGESLIVCSSFVLAAVLRLGSSSLLALTYEQGFYKILGITALVLIFLNFFDLYDLSRVPSGGDSYKRLLVVMGLLSCFLAGLGYLFPGFMLRKDSFLFGLLILTVGLLGWRSCYAWLIRQPYLRERVCVLGTGYLANCLVENLRSRPELGMDMVGWLGAIDNGSMSRENLESSILDRVRGSKIDRVIIALGDRRGVMPARALLGLRLRGVKVDDATSILERISGKIEVDGLYPSWLIFSDGFRLNPTNVVGRRAFSVIASIVCLLVLLPIMPLIALLIKLSSPGPVIYRQRRIGRDGRVFTCYKFRTMQEDAEASGAMWADEDDPRVTTVGRALRRMRLDEIPQLWNVLRGDMALVGPRPERIEFMEWLSTNIPYYYVRHVICPGITGWAQVCYRYGASLEDSKEKLKYDLYYIKNMSLFLDLAIILRSIKIVVLGRGAR
jgi:sugar transferase (PEP-CTERM system associated)